MNLLRIIGLIALFVTAVLVFAYIVAAFVLTVITSLFTTT
jgi:phage shock protein PspC (stress-responsive transcriptional regulator)